MLRGVGRKSVVAVAVLVLASGCMSRSEDPETLNPFQRNTVGFSSVVIGATPSTAAPQVVVVGQSQPAANVVEPSTFTAVPPVLNAQGNVDRSASPQGLLCASADSDPDGDGYGYENGASCRVVRSSAPIMSVAIQPLEPAPTIDGAEVLTADQALPACQSAASDPDGDGYGYEHQVTCRVLDQQSIEDDSVELPHNVASDGFPVNLHLVTDVILTAGQSNAFANGTRFEPDRYPRHDRVDDRILVWTQDNGWKVANPQKQIWEHDQFPARPWEQASSNSPGLQIARAIVDADPERVVAFIPTSAPGEAIEYWRYDAQPYHVIKRRVEHALNDIPHKHQLDLIWWMQGESDANATDYYRNALTDLVNNWRSEPWYGADKYFIANETVRFEVNQIFRELRSDADPYTDYSPAEGLPTILQDGVHFDSQSYRIIGDRVRQVYFDMLSATGQ